jgi:hypothetical protein
LKLTITVMSIPGVARGAAGGFQQVRSLAKTSLMLSTRAAGSACADAINDGNSNDAAKQTSLLGSAAITRLSWLT